MVIETNNGSPKPANRPRRWPGWVFNQGVDPDPRFSLANERTFLAWIRTSLALFAAGIALEALTLPIAPGLRRAAAIVLIVLGAAAPVQAWIGWLRTEAAMRLGRSLPPPALAVPLGLGLVAAGGLILIGLVR
ncbi:MULTISPECIES: YidH family protein [unclassified Micromonospora]|uniref:YidH family protein n=1 Tax=Micromonospora sp. NPDC005087 TaxID=3364225 RepID=UPI0036C499B4